MTTWKMTRAISGLLVLASLLLGTPQSPLYVTGDWIYLAAMVGINLLQSGLTGWCLEERLLHRMGVRHGM